MKQFKYRFLRTIIIIFSIACLNFFLLKNIPGDIADILASQSGASDPEYVQQIRETYGLDKPITTQFIFYLKDLITLDLGYSARFNIPVRDLLISRMGPTIYLMICAILFAIFFGLLGGLVSARKNKNWVDKIITAWSMIWFSTPFFWSGLMAIILFSVKLDLLPTGGFIDIRNQTFNIYWVLDVLKHTIMPAIILGLFYSAIYIKLVKIAALEVLRQNYIITAKAKGLSNWMIYRYHVLRNSSLPVVTMIGLQMGEILGGSVLIETVFSWPGLGRLTYESVLGRDLTTLLAILFLSSILVLVSNIITDIICRMIDPRVTIS